MYEQPRSQIASSSLIAVRRVVELAQERVHAWHQCGCIALRCIHPSIQANVCGWGKLYVHAAQVSLHLHFTAGQCNYSAEVLVFAKGVQCPRIALAQCMHLSAISMHCTIQLSPARNRNKYHPC